MNLTYKGPKRFHKGTAAEPKASHEPEYNVYAHVFKLAHTHVHVSVDHGDSLVTFLPFWHLLTIII